MRPIASRGMQLQPDGSDAIEVRAGEIVLLPHNSAHTFGRELIPTPVPVREVIQAPKEGGLGRIVPEAAFSRASKRQFGESPGSWRKASR